MLESLGWGAVAASSLVIGAVLALVRPWPGRLVGLVLGFGAGALVASVSFELAEEGLRIGSAYAVAAGLALGGLTYFLADRLVDRWGGRSGGSSAGAPSPSVRSSTASPSRRSSASASRPGRA